LNLKGTKDHRETKDSEILARADAKITAAATTTHRNLTSKQPYQQQQHLLALATATTGAETVLLYFKKTNSFSIESFSVKNHVP